MLRSHGVLTILASKSLSPAGLVQILRSSTSNAPKPSSFNGFGFWIALAHRWGANFPKLNLKKCSELFLALTILACESLSRAGVVQILLTSWAADPSQLPFLGADFARPRSHETLEKHSISRNSYPPESLMSCICAVKHLCCPTSMLQELAATFSIVGSWNF